jgi:hypothetical protein
MVRRAKGPASGGASTTGSAPAESSCGTRGGVRLSTRDAQQIIEAHNLPVFLTLEQAASVCQLAPGTLRNHVSEGRYARSAVRGKPLRFVTQLFLKEFAER